MNHRILHLLWDGHLGGVQRYVAALTSAAGWDRSQHGICLFSRSGQVLNGTTVGALPLWELGLKHGWQLYRARRSLLARLSDFQPDVIHCHCDTPAFLLQLKGFKRHKLVYHEHGDSLVRPASERYMRFFWRRQGPLWDKIIHNAHFSKRHFVERYPWLEPQSVVVPNPLTQRWQGAHVAFRHHSPVVGVFGRLSHVKGVDRMIAAARIIKDTRPDVLIHIYGDGECRGDLERQANALGVSDMLQFQGYVPDPLAKMAQMDCVVVPSRIESFGLVALEAQSVGTPVVAFDHTGVTEIVQHGETGYLVNQQDLPALAQAILAVLQDPEHAAILGQKAQERALTQFSLQAHVDRLKQVYASLFHEDTPAGPPGITAA